jgi:cystathionine gamma-synthase/cystathionine gamma-lyase
MKLSTKAVHVGQEVDPQTFAVIPPVYFNSTYFQDGVGHHKGFDYSRADHPNRAMLEQALAALENGSYASCFASGCAAATAVLSTLGPGDHVLATDDLYGGTYRLFKQVFEKWGLRFDFVGWEARTSEIATMIRKETKLIWIETPTNPLLKIFEISRFIKARGKRREVRVLVDNTFATPISQQPLDLEADLVLHSTTKYIGGHSDVVGGVLVYNEKALRESLRFYQKSAGAVPGPMDCYLTHRGLKTLPLRMKAHDENARHLAEVLKSHPQIEQVFYPGFQPEEMKRNHMKLAGGMISFELKRLEPDGFFKKLQLIRLAESLGGVESLICYPTLMTHGAIPEAQKAKIGITKKLIRLSVGIEDVEDLQKDLEQALA